MVDGVAVGAYTSYVLLPARVKSALEEARRTYTSLLRSGDSDARRKLMDLEGIGLPVPEGTVPFTRVGSEIQRGLREGEL